MYIYIYIYIYISQWKLGFLKSERSHLKTTSMTSSLGLEFQVITFKFIKNNNKNTNNKVSMYKNYEIIECLYKS